jgi:L-threonylcarbamoyladenylate synthase
METTILSCRKGRLDDDDLQLCMRVFQAGGVVVFPTETVYGIGCNAFFLPAIHTIYALKGRSYTKPLPLLLGDQSQLPLVARDIPSEAWSLAQAFWPGPMTLVLKTASLASAATRGKETVAIRIPNHGTVRQILLSLNLPLATTSANLSGHPAAKDFNAVKKSFFGQVPLMIDGGKCSISKESTVVDAIQFPFTILREGALVKSKLAAHLGLM